MALHVRGRALAFGALPRAEESVGIAYGVVTAVQNMGLAGIPLIVAMVYNASGETYIPYVELLFVCFAVRE